jgi:acyl carrier protein
LQRDLELDPLDLVLIALRIEDVLQIQFPIAELAQAILVGDLVRIVRSMCASTAESSPDLRLRSA